MAVGPDVLKSLFARISPALIRQETRDLTRVATDDERRLAELCAMPVEEAMRRLSVTERGLEAGEVEKRRDEYGPNEVIIRQGGGPLAEILRRLRNPLVIQLLVIAVVSLAMGDMR
jgi:Mg2+-importing ATPase